MHNPLEALIGIRNDNKEVCVASPEEVRTLINWVAENDCELIPYFSIGFFAELEILEFSQINYEENVISVYSTKTAKKRRRQVPFEPNLLKWLLPYQGWEGELIDFHHTNLAIEKTHIRYSDPWRL